MELVDLYDEQRRPTGRLHRRGAYIQKGDYVLVACAWIGDGKGRVLLTLRAPEKLACPNTWENSGGGARAGEDSVQAVLRELREETGIVAGPHELVYMETDQTRDAFIDFYFLIHPVPLEELTLQPGETADACWVTLEEMDGLIAQGVVATPLANRFPHQRKILEKLVGTPEHPGKTL